MTEWFRGQQFEVRVWPDDLSLRLVAREVVDWDDPAAPEDQRELRRLVVGMGTTMYATGGAGLAAPQVGVQRRVVVLKEQKVKGGPAGRKPSRMVGAFALVNPRVVERLDGEDEDLEGCLSLPGVRVVVPRSVRVVVEHESTYGETLLVEMRGLEARVAQHEIDHLDGKLIVDYLGLADRRAVVAEMVRMREAMRAEMQRMTDGLHAMFA